MVRVVQHYHWRGLTHAQQYEKIRDLVMSHWKRHEGGDRRHRDRGGTGIVS